MCIDVRLCMRVYAQELLWCTLVIVEPAVLSGPYSAVMAPWASTNLSTLTGVCVCVCVCVCAVGSLFDRHDTNLSTFTGMCVCLGV